MAIVNRTHKWIQMERKMWRLLFVWFFLHRWHLITYYVIRVVHSTHIDFTSLALSFYGPFSFIPRATRSTTKDCFFSIQFPKTKCRVSGCQITQKKVEKSNYSGLQKKLLSRVSTLRKKGIKQNKRHKNNMFVYVCTSWKSFCLRCIVIYTAQQSVFVVSIRKFIAFTQWRLCAMW